MRGRLQIFRKTYKAAWKQHGMQRGDALRILCSKSGRSPGDFHPDMYVSLTSRYRGQRLWRGVHPQGVQLFPVDRHCKRFRRNAEKTESPHLL